MKVVLANIFNQSQMIIVKIYDEKNVIAEEFDDFDNAVHFLVKSGFTIKSEHANERGEYSLWFEKIHVPVLAKPLQDERANIEKANTLTGVHLDDFRTENVSKASENDDAYTKMMANQIAAQKRKEILDERFDDLPPNITY